MLRGGQPPCTIALGEISRRCSNMAYDSVCRQSRHTQRQHHLGRNFSIIRRRQFQMLILHTSAAYATTLIHVVRCIAAIFCHSNLHGMAVRAIHHCSSHIEQHHHKRYRRRQDYVARFLQHPSVFLTFSSANLISISHTTVNRCAILIIFRIFHTKRSSGKKQRAIFVTLIVYFTRLH